MRRLALAGLLLISCADNAEPDYWAQTSDECTQWCAQLECDAQELQDCSASCRERLDGCQPGEQVSISYQCASGPGRTATEVCP